MASADADPHRREFSSLEIGRTLRANSLPRSGGIALATLRRETVRLPNLMVTWLLQRRKD